MTMLELDHSSATTVSQQIDAFLAGDAPLQGLDLYYALERVTSLRDFHTMLRAGPQNRTRSGLQQSYGDHNRLLLLGLDRLVAGDVEWYRGRVESQGSVPDDRLCACLAAAAGLAIDRPSLVALWLGAALHDCGMLGGAPGEVDVEDGVALAAPLLDALCPAEQRELAAFAIRNHDFIKNVFTGEVPAALITRQLLDLAPSIRPTALAALGMIQVAGAASLGEGRLTTFRVDIFERCLRGDALHDHGPVDRLGRLLREGEASVAPPDERVAADALARLDDPARERVCALLASASLLGWHKHARGHRAPVELTDELVMIASRWAGTGARHVVLTSCVRAVEAKERLHRLGNGATALVLAA